MTRSAKAIHDESIIIDGMFTKFDVPIPATEAVPDLMLDHLLDSGVTAVNHSLIADPFPMSTEAALMSLYDGSLLFEAFPEKVLLVRNTDDIRTAKETGRLAVIHGTQGLQAIGTNVRYLWVFHTLGVRLAQLTYNEGNALGSGCMEPNDSGLTRFGQTAIDHMNRLGIVLDLSHVGRKTSLQAIEYTKAPPVFSHASVLALCEHRRNLTDEQIKAVAEKGGVIGLCPHSVFVEKARGKWPTLSDYIDHIDYVVDLVGIDHAGVGTDNFEYETHFSRKRRLSFSRTFATFYGGYEPEQKHVQGFGKWPEWINLTTALLERGYSEEDTKKLLGGNFMRVFQEIWG